MNDGSNFPPILLTVLWFMTSYEGFVQSLHQQILRKLVVQFVAS